MQSCMLLGSETWPLKNENGMSPQWAEIRVIRCMCGECRTVKTLTTRMRANAQRDGCPAEHRWRPLFNAAKFD